MEIGYKLSSEEHDANELVRLAGRAEAAGFGFAAISDHFHPWVDRQGESPFVWGVLGGIARETGRIRVGTAVTCPTVRIHPAIVAQAAATAAQMLEGRFFLGLGSGEALNEHVLGDPWPPAAIRLEMLEEAVGLIRELWEGGQVTHRGEHYVVDNARIYTLPDEPPSILVAGSGPKSAALAGRVGDGFIGLAPSEDLIGAFDEAGGRGKPRYCEINLCWAEDEEDARRTVLEWWPISGMGGQLNAELALPSLFEAVAETVGPEDFEDTVPLGPDPERHLDAIRTFAEAGYDHIWLHQIGPDQDGFFRFFEEELRPKLG